MAWYCYPSKETIVCVKFCKAGRPDRLAKRLGEVIHPH